MILIRCDPAMVQDFRIFSPVTEAINGRAAMLGFAVAVLSEIATGACPWPSQTLRSSPHIATIPLQYLVAQRANTKTLLPEVNQASRTPSCNAGAKPSLRTCSRPIASFGHASNTKHAASTPGSSADPLRQAAGQSVWSQIAGKMVNEEYVERATGLSGVTFAAAVTLLTFATFAPMVLNQEGLASRCGLTISFRL